MSVVLSAIYIAAPRGVTPAAITDCRLAQPVTPETVYSSTPAGRRSKSRNLIICVARAGFEPMTSSTQSNVISLDQPDQSCGWLENNPKYPT